MRALSAGMAARVCSGHLLLPWHPSKQMALHPIPKQLLPPPLQNMPSPPCTLSLWSLVLKRPLPRAGSQPLSSHPPVNTWPPVCHMAALGSRPGSPPAPVPQPLLPAWATCPSCLSWERTGPNCRVGGCQRADPRSGFQKQEGERRQVSLLSGALTQTPSRVSHATPTPPLALSPRVASLEPCELASLKIISTGIWPVCKA